MTSSAGATAPASSVPLAMADSFGVLAGTGITNTGVTTVNGDVGTAPIITTSGTAIIVNGTDHGGDSTTDQAKLDLGTAYGNAEGQASVPIVGDLGGQVLTPGVYNSASTIALTGTLTLDALNNPSAVFVLQAGTSLTTAANSEVNLFNNAQACNVFWQVGSSAGLGADSTLRGSILALTSITVGARVIVDGRLLAQDGTVTLDADTITKPTCSGTTAVATRAFSARHGKNGVTLRWNTASEVDVLGFNVYRQDSAKRVRLNPALIAGQATGTTAGRAYVFVDHPARLAKAPRYWLQVVHLDGSRTWFGSTQARFSL